MTHLADAVGELLKAQSTRVHCLPGAPERFYTVRAPSLLDQLADAVANSTGVHAHSVPGPRLPLSAEAIDLWYQILTSLHGWARELGLQRRQINTWSKLTLSLQAPVRPLTTPADLLRLLKVAAVKPGHEEIADAIARRCWCGKAGIDPNDCGRCWAHRIQAMLAPELADREIRGAACPECSATTTVIERDGERLRVPTIVVRVAALPDAGPEDLWVYRMCRACGSEGWLDYTTQSAA